MTRQASSQATAKTVSAPSRSLTTKETEKLIDRLQKENFDVKHRLCLAQERNRKLEEELDERTEGLEQYTALQGKHESLQRRFEALEQEKEDLEGERGELLQMKDELVKELRKRDAAVDEAATMIHKLECKAAEFDEKLADMRMATAVHQDLGYHSAEADTEAYERCPSRTKSTSRPSSPAQESGYFSGASSSPNPPPRMPRPLSRRAGNAIRPDPPKRDPSGTFSSGPLNFDRPTEPIVTPPVYRHQHRMTPHPPLRRSKTHLGAVIAVPVTNLYPPQSNPIPIPTLTPSRPLRSLYNSGELSRRIHSDDPPVPPPFPLLDRGPSSFVEDDDIHSIWSTSETHER